MSGKIDPMHQFTVEPLVPLHIGAYDVSLTNSAAWMLAALVVIGVFMWGGMKRQVVPGRWQMAAEGLTGFIDNLVQVNIGPEGKKYIPYIFSLFAFILVVNLQGLLPLIIPIEVISFLVRPFSLALRLFVAMMSGHILMEVFGSFIVNGFASGSPVGFGVGFVSFLFIVGVGALELLVCALQAYVFALLTSLYLNDAINLH